MRDCSRVRKVCDSTTGRPPSLIMFMPSGGRPAVLALNGTKGLTPSIRSMPWSSTVDACIVRRSAPSTK